MVSMGSGMVSYELACVRQHLCTDSSCGFDCTVHSLRWALLSELSQGVELSLGVYHRLGTIGWVRLGDQGPEGPLCRGAAPIPRAGLGDARRASPKSGAQT